MGHEVVNRSSPIPIEFMMEDEISLKLKSKISFGSYIYSSPFNKQSIGCKSLSKEIILIVPTCYLEGGVRIDFISIPNLAYIFS